MRRGTLERAARRVLGVLLAALPACARAQAPYWANTGPVGAIATCVAADATSPGVVYLGVEDGGVFRYDPVADRWVVSNTGLARLDMLSIAISPADPATLLAGTDGGLFVTHDRGAHWAAAGGAPAMQTNAIAFDPISPANVYAVSLEGWVGKSTDGGATWQALGGDASGQRPLTVTVDPTNGSRVYVGTLDNGVYRSENGGASWTAINAGLTNLHVTAIAFHPTNPSIVYAGTDNGGAFRSQDGGTTWTAFSAGLGSNDVDAILVNTEGRAFLASRTGIYGTDNQGLAWTLVDVTDFNNALALGPGSPQPLYFAYGQAPQYPGGVRYHLGGQSFSMPSYVGLNAVNVNSLAVDPFHPNRVLTVGPLRGFESPDGGVTWNEPFAFGLALSIAFDPQAAGVVYQGVAAGVFKSTDGGVQWGVVTSDLPTNPLVRALLFPPGFPGRLLAGTTSGVWRSEDGGQSWVAPGTELPDTVYALSASPSTSDIWAGGHDGVYRSSDGGINWTRAGSPSPVPVYAVLESAAAHKVFAGTSVRLLASSDGGGTFNPVAGGLPALDVRALKEDAARGAIYVGGIGGVFESLDGGTTWAPAAQGLTNPQIQALAVLPSGTLLAGARAGSVFRRVGGASVERATPERSRERGATREVGPRP